jgi:hypothetical protein
VVVVVEKTLLWAEEVVVVVMDQTLLWAERM